MKSIKFFLAALVVTLGVSACQSVNVATDYDKTADFDNYKTFAFYKPGIDKAKISDLDKRRILRAIDSSLSRKNMSKSKEPDLLVSIFTDATQNIEINQNYYGYGYGWGWHDPWYWGYSPYYNYNNHNNAYQGQTDGTLYIDLIDAETKNLIWQGVGTGAIKPDGSVDEKTDHINKIVKEILNHYPPDLENK